MVNIWNLGTIHDGIITKPTNPDDSEKWRSENFNYWKYLVLKKICQEKNSDEFLTAYKLGSWITRFRLSGCSVSERTIRNWLERWLKYGWVDRVEDYLDGDMVIYGYLPNKITFELVEGLGKFFDGS